MKRRKKDSKEFTKHIELVLERHLSSLIKNFMTSFSAFLY